MDKLKQNLATLKIINKCNITYNPVSKVIKINKSIRVQDLKLFRAMLIINHIDYKDIVVEAK